MFVLVSGFSFAALNDGIISYYTFNESGSLTDLYGVNTMGEVGTVALQVGVINNSRGTYSDTAYFNKSNATQLNTNSSYSVQLWLKLSAGCAAANFGGLVLGDTSNNALYANFFYCSGTAQLQSNAWGNNLASGINLNTSNFTHAVFTYNGTTKNMSLYVNGVLRVSAINAQNGVSANYWLMGIGTTGLSNPSIVLFYDEGAVWNRSLNASEISQLYNNGYGVTLFPSVTSVLFVSPTPSNNSAQFYNNNSLTLNVSTNNIVGTVNITQFVYFANGSIAQSFSNLSSNLSHTFSNLSVGKYFFNVTANNGSNNTLSETRIFYIYNISASNITVPLNNSNATRFLNVTWTNASTTNTSIVAINNFRVILLNNNSVFNRTLNTTSALSLSNFDLYTNNISIGSYYLVVEANDTNGNKINSTPILFNLNTDASLNITAFNITGGSIANFSVNVTDLSSLVTYSYTSSSGTIFADIIKGHNYSILFDAVGFAYLNVTYSANQSSLQFLSSTLFPNNSVNLSIYDAITGVLVSGNVTVVVTASSIRTFTVAGGNIILSNLDVGNNEIKVYSSVYAESRYTVNVPGRSTSNLSVYLTFVNASTNFTLTFYDDNGAVISGVYVRQSALINSSYILTMDGFTDITGKVYFSYNPSYYYYYNATHPDYVSEYFNLTPPRDSDYAITMSSISGSIDYYRFNVNGSALFNNISNILTFNYTSGEVSVSNYSYTVSKIINSRANVICFGSSSLLANSFTCNLNGYEGLVYVQGVANNSQIFFGQYVNLGNGAGLFDNVDRKDAAYILGFIVAIITFGGLVYGVWATLVLGAAGMMVAYWLNALSALSIAVIGVDIIIVIVLVQGMRRY